MTMIERAVEAALVEIEREDHGDYLCPYVSRREGCVVIDGEVDMAAVVRAVLRVIREPDEAMNWRAYAFSEERKDGVAFWQATIDAALSE